MTHFCPKCQAPLASETEACAQCAARRIEFELQLKSIVELIEVGDDSTALAKLNALLDLAPRERLAECYSIRGYAQLKQLDFERAEEDCSESIALDWEQAQAYEWRAAARSKRNQWRLAFDDLDRAYEWGGVQQDRYLELMSAMAVHAKRYYQELAKQGALGPDALADRGWVALRLNQFEDALSAFSQVLKHQAGHPWASLGLAELYLKREKLKGWGRVEQLCDDALTGSPACRWQAQSIRAQLHYKLGDLFHAKQALQKLAEGAASSPLALAQSAELMMQLGDHVSAIDCWNQVLDARPELGLAIRKRGDCYAAIRNYGLALPDYTAYLDLYPESVTGLVLRSKVLSATQKFSAAVADLTRALELEPAHFEANLRFGHVQAELGRLDLAVHHCRLAVQLDSRQAEGYAVLASVYHRLSDYRPTLEEYSRSIELAPTIPERAQYRFLRGIAAYQNDDFESALTDLKQATEERPHHAGQWIWLAATYSRLEDWPGAITALQQAIQARPSAAEQYQLMGKPIAEKAIQFYRRAEQRLNEPAPAQLFLKRGLAHQFLDQHDAAVQDFSAGLERKPKDQELLILRGKSLSRVGQWEQAAEDFSGAISRVPDDHRPYYYRSLVRVQRQDLDSAKEDLAQAIRLAANHPRYLLTLGELELKSGDRQAALKHFDRAILLDPTNPISYRLRGLTHWAQRDDQHEDHRERLAAIRDFTHSLELHPDQADLLVWRAQAFQKSNQPLSALADFETALALNDRQANAYSGRASILVTQQRHEYALIWLTKALHRFSEPADLAEIILARGRVYLEMARHKPAINDFSFVMKMMSRVTSIEAAARFARAVAKLHDQQWDSARKDLLKLANSRAHPRTKPVFDPRVDQALEWLADTRRPQPTFLKPPVGVIRPTRPPALRTGVVLTNGTVSRWSREPPFDQWVLRSEHKQEYGPVSLTTLADWASEGRLVNGMKLLRADWSKWKRIEKIFPEVTPLESLKGLIDEFPTLDLKKHKKS